MTPDVKSSGRNHENGVDAGQLSPDQGNKSDLLDDEEDFFDFISRWTLKVFRPSLFIQFSLDSNPSEWMTRGVP